MGPQNQFDRAEAQIERDFDDGLMTQAEYNREMRELQRDYRSAAVEAAMDAYEREMGQW